MGLRLRGDDGYSARDTNFVPMLFSPADQAKTKKKPAVSGLQTIFLEENSGDGFIMLQRKVSVQFRFQIPDIRSHDNELDTASNQSLTGTV
ncbi:hypothetical protein HH212_01830 [Massilia forsythiae]|uniref:Uncharacterized protein n=1 Tax=Massilia forsythiae TaxID=2728020 RepID=A0A7Z2ZRA4_9BURK|nr:hypothetical protein [Massilia forsythiae]QJD98929.1 hypothetical protein HH212_01830 [Massilia forsythiae]